MQLNRVSLTEGVVWKQILRFAVPLLLSNLMQQLYNTADLLILGNYAGRNAMAAVGATGPLINSLLGLFIGLATGCSVMVARHYGAEDYKALSDAVHTAIAIALGAGLILTIGGYLLSPLFLEWMATPAEIMRGAVSYMRIFFLGTIANMIYNMGSGILRSVGDSQRPFVFLSLSVVMNIVLDILFVGAFHWGVDGAAWATILSQIFAALLVSYSLLRSPTSYRVFIRDIRFHSRELRTALQIGVPAGLQSVLVSFSNVLIQAVVNTFGAAAVAGFAVGLRIDGFVFVSINALSLAVMTSTGQNMGAARYDRVRQGLKSGILMVTILCVVLGLSLLALAAPLSAAFNRDPDVIFYSVRCLQFLFPLYFIFGINEILGSTLRGAGRSLAPMIITLICMCGLRMVWIYSIMPLWGSSDVVFMAFPIAWIATMIVQLTYARMVKWIPDQE